MRTRRCLLSVSVVLMIAACGSEGPRAEPAATYVVRLDEAFEPEPFTEVSGIARLDDGTVIVADRVEGGLVPVASDGQRGDPFGSEGQGPGEFMRITEIGWLEGDTFAVVDGQQRRVIVYTSDGGVVEQFDYPEEVRMSPRGVSSNGLVARAPLMESDEEQESRLPLIAWSWESNRIDTLTMVRHRPLHLWGGRTGSTPWTVQLPERYAPEDVWGVTREGDVVVVAADPYRVEIHSSGERRVGPLLDHRPVPVTAEDRERVEEGLRGRPPWSWRDAKSPFRPERIWVNGEAEEVWVQTWEEREGEAWYDRLAFSGERLGRIVMGTEMRPVALHGTEIYLIEEDELGFQWLRRGGLQRVERAATRD